jgi:hypothetical protein
MTKAEEKRRETEQAKIRLMDLLNDTGHVYTVLNHVSSSGMTRHISCYVAVVIQHTKKPAIVNITWYISKMLDLKRSRNNGGLVVGGCGMDMGYHIVYSLSSALYKNGFKCFGKDCHSNDHVNGPCKRIKGRKHHKDGGYALTQEWL